MTPGGMAPAGGYGGAPGGGGFGPTAGPPQGSSGGKAVVIILVVVGALVLVLGTLSVLAIFGVRKYIANAKNAEVRNSLGQMAKDAAVAYEREDLTRTGAIGEHRVCPSATFPVPRDAASVSGKKYQSAPSEWTVDEARNAGFACLRFELSQPQYYQYRYEATPSSFVAGGRGDLNGDGKFSDYRITGEVRDSRLLIAPSILETDPDE